MKVRELIELLEKQEPDMEVCLAIPCRGLRLADFEESDMKVMYCLDGDEEKVLRIYREIDPEYPEVPADHQENDPAEEEDE